MIPYSDVITIINIMQSSVWLCLAVLVAVCAASGYNTTVAIVATNDIHGAALPTLMQRADSG